MADMNSDTSSGENSGNSNSTDKSKASKKSRTLRTQNWTSKSMSDQDGGVVGNRKAIYDDLVDRQSASKAVAIVVHTASKRGYVPLCTEFASLIRENKRMELEINRLRFIINQMRKKGVASIDSKPCYSSSSASESGSGGSQGFNTKKTVTKMTVTTSPGEETQNTQEQMPSSEENQNISERLPENKHVYEELKKAKHQILKLEGQNKMLTAENRALKAQAQHSEMYNDRLKCIENKINKGTKDRISPEQLPTHPSLAKETLNPNVDNVKHDENCCLKSCVKHRRNHGSRTHTTHKMSPKLSSKPISPHVIEDSTTTIGNNLTPLHKGSQSHDKNQLKPKLLPKLGDFVTVQGEIKGYVNYVGPVKGESSNFVGIQLPSPVGNNDGSMDGVKYFSCPQNYGAFVPLQDIKHVDQRPSKPFQS